MAKIIGLTGGIGSGKTTIANYFATAGIPIYIADDEAKKIMETPVILEAIQLIFGDTVFEQGKLIRAKLATIVFTHPEKLIKLNSIVHPAVKKHFKNWVVAQEKAAWLLYESAILFESGNYKDFDSIISITAPIESRIDRVLKRDKTTREQVLNRINSQWTDEQRTAKSDFVIENNTLDASKKKVLDILKILKIKQNES